MKISLRTKLFLVIFLLVASAVIIFAGLGILRFSRFGKLFYDSNMEQDEIISETTDRTMLEDATDSFQKYVESDADLIDGEFWTMEDDLVLLATNVKDILENPESYGERQINELVRTQEVRLDEGKISCCLLYSSDADKENEEAVQKIHKLANLSAAMKYIVREEGAMHDIIIDLPEGPSIVAYRHPWDRVTGNDGDLFYDVSARPDYIGAVETGDVFFAPLIYDEKYGEYKVSVGIPVYVDGKFAAFVGGSRFISDLDEMMEEMSESIGPDSFICLVNSDGRVIFSERKEGELAAGEGDGNNIARSLNHELTGLAKEALAGKEGFAKVSIDSETTYIAYAPLKTVGWTLLLGVSEETLTQPSKELVSQVDEITMDTLKRTDIMFKRTQLTIALMAVVLIFITVFTSLRYSRKLVSPVLKLKKAADSFIKREDIGLEYEHDFFGSLELYTGDETEDLWLTMRDLEQNIRKSMQRLQEVTAEKERIDTELSIAARIQSDMLPKKFPAFPERKEFDLFSMMKPAKEVGGDFYDFFLTDEDHLVLVMADVSGKGVPAALLMVVAKTMIRNISMSEGGTNPGKTLYTVNNHLCENNDECMFVTVWLGCVTLHTGEVVWANAGHEYPCICRKDGEFELIRDEHGPGLGSFENVEFTEQKLKLQPGDVLFLYTDGIPEASDGRDNIFGLDRMKEALDKGIKGNGPDMLAASVKKSVDEFAGQTPQFDDITMTVFEYKGS